MRTSRTALLLLWCATTLPGCLRFEARPGDITIPEHLAALYALYCGLYPLSCGLASTPATAATAQGTLYSANADVLTVLRDGNTLYLGGAFTQVGVYTGNGTLLDPNTAAVAR